MPESSELAGNCTHSARIAKIVGWLKEVLKFSKRDACMQSGCTVNQSCLDPETFQQKVVEKFLDPDNGTSWQQQARPHGRTQHSNVAK